MTLIKRLFSPVDLTKGVPWKQILLFSIPMLLGNIAQQLYNTVDSIVVGQNIGDNALAAVGSASPVLNLVLVFYVGIGMGASILVSHYFGSRNKEDLAKTIGNSITLTFIASLIITFIGIFTIRPLLNILNTPAAIIEWSYSYLFIIFVGVIGCGYYNILSGILRGLGDSVSALLYLLVATIINIILDIVFVVYFNMGVAGVALATVIAQGISAICCMIKLLNKKDIFHLQISDLWFSKELCDKLFNLGVPTGITQAIFSLSMIIVQSLTNSYGEMFIAANVIVMRIDAFAMMPNFSFGTAMTTYAGQNIGAKEYDRLHEGTVSGTKIAILTSTIITICLLIFGKYLMFMFTDNLELVDLSYKMMTYLAVGYVAFSITQCLGGVIRGAGDTMTPMWISILSSVLIRVPLAYFIAYITANELLPNGIPDSIYISLLIAWILGALFTFIAYRRENWKKKIAGFNDGNLN